MHKNIVASLAISLTLSVVSAAIAHTGEEVRGLVSGFLRTVLGLDHPIAMLAVGIWDSFLGKLAILILPVLFPLVMAVAAAAGAAGILLPGVEPGIALSGIALGLAVLFAVRAPLWVALVLTGLFAVLHGHAHRTELPVSANPLEYAVGFVVATCMLHLVGTGIGYFAERPAGRLVVRGAGAAIALAGTAFLTGLA